MFVNDFLLCVCAWGSVREFYEVERAVRIMFLLLTHAMHLVIGVYVYPFFEEDSPRNLNSLNDYCLSLRHFHRLLTSALIGFKSVNLMKADTGRMRCLAPTCIHSCS